MGNKALRTAAKFPKEFLKSIGEEIVGSIIWSIVIGSCKLLLRGVLSIFKFWLP
jgi:hypothetical protein